MTTPPIRFEPTTNEPPAVKCPECGADVWDVARASKLHKCWTCGTAFDTPANADELAHHARRTPAAGTLRFERGYLEYGNVGAAYTADVGVMVTLPELRRLYRIVGDAIRAHNPAAYLVPVPELTDAELARALRTFEDDYTDDETFAATVEVLGGDPNYLELMGEAFARIGVPLDETEMGPTAAASDALDAWVARTLADADAET